MEGLEKKVHKMTLIVFQMDKYPLLRDQVEKIVVQHGRKGEAKSKDQVRKDSITVFIFICLFVGFF